MEKRKSTKDRYIEKDLIVNKNTHKAWLSIERDADGKITDWEITICTSDAIKVLQDAIDEKNSNGDTRGIKEMKALLQALIDIEKRKQNKP